MTERALASIQVIESITPIPEADAIETARVLGWDVVVRKDLGYKPGDVVVFYEIDSVLPDNPVYEEMLRGKPWSPRAARLKTVRFRGQLSQGYLRHAADVLDTNHLGATSIGTDVTELLGVTKYEPPLPTDAAAIAGHWLVGVPKTDEQRCQSNPGLVQALQGAPYVITVKLDGMSGTFGYDDEGQFWACSRNFRLRPGNNPHTKVAERFQLSRILQRWTDGEFDPRYVIQGEVCGPGIQGNRLKLDEPSLFVFDIFDKETNEYLPWLKVRDFCVANLIPMVPVLEVGSHFHYTIADLLALADGHYPSGERREGIVIRGSADTSLQRRSFKCISNKFLLQEGVAAVAFVGVPTVGGD